MAGVIGGLLLAAFAYCAVDWYVERDGGARFYVGAFVVVSIAVHGVAGVFDAHTLLGRLWFLLILVCPATAVYARRRRQMIE